MAEIVLPRSTDVTSLRHALAGADGDDIDIRFSDGCFIETGAIALLTSWLLSQRSKGRHIRLSGDETVQSYLARMNFHRVLGLAEPDHGRAVAAGRFIPILLVENDDDVFAAVNEIADVVLQQFDNAADFLPAFEWAVNEIVDNVFIHSLTKSPGVVCAQTLPQKNVNAGTILHQSPE